MSYLQTVGKAAARSPIEDERARSAELEADLRSIPGQKQWLADLHGLGVANLRGEFVADRLRAAFGDAPESVGGLIQPGGVWAARLAADEFLLIGQDQAAIEPNLGSLGDDQAGKWMTVTDMTHGFSVLAVGGEQSRRWLGKLTALDLRGRTFPDSRVAQTALANVHATVIRNDIAGSETFVVLVGRSMGAFVWQALVEASGPRQPARIDGDTIRERWFAE